MTSSDEEGEIFPDSVSDYEFVNQEDELVSFVFLPLLWPKESLVDTVNFNIFLSGVSDDGLQKVYKKVVAWRYELSFVRPEISVLCKGNLWVKLLKPKKLFEATVRSILITIQCLYYVKHNLEATKSSVWSHLSRVFSAYEVAPSEVDCMNHISLIRKAAERDKTLFKSEEGLPVKRTDFIVDDVDDPCESDDSTENEEDFFDTCCSLCDNGGDILSCERRCMRSFHATEASGEGLCESLGLSIAQVNAIPVFKCKNCQYQQHQCFICGKLGSSDLSSNPEVFPCIAANCGRFYNPSRVSKELDKRNDSLEEDLEKKIAAGESFACPVHKCIVCKHVEDREVEELLFAVCRRCPKSYHRKCLPREIPFEDDNEHGILQRAWDGLLLKHILIYCLDHDIDPTLCTPLRNHILFPGMLKERKLISEQRLTNVLLKKRKTIPYCSTTESVKRKIGKLNANHNATEFVEQKILKKADIVKYHNLKGSDLNSQVGKVGVKPSSDAQKNASFSNLMSASRDHVKFFPTLAASKTAPEKSKFDSDKNLKSNVVQHGNADKSCKKFKIVCSAKPMLEKQSCSSPVDSQMEKRIIALMEKVNASFDVEEFNKKQNVPSIYKASRNTLDKTLTKMKVEVTVKAIRTALQKLDNGGTVKDAKTVCSAEMLRQIPLWKIVQRLHWYAQDGDTIGDFCCGANDFSCLMKRSWTKWGRSATLKITISFRQRMISILSKGIGLLLDPVNCQKIMGLTPFGVKASLANQFINNALKFKPKLLILIVPPETRRLDLRMYDLIWEDSDLLSGESFYLPGSFNNKEQQLSQWNVITPPLYLWSRHDWTRKHLEIANRSGQSQFPGQPSCSQLPTWNYLLEDQQDCYGDFSNLMNVYGSFPSLLADVLLPDHNHDLNEHNFNGNFVASNGAVFNNSSTVTSFENPRAMNAAGWLETNVCSSPVDLEDWNIFPTDSPSNIIS